MTSVFREVVPSWIIAPRHTAALVHLQTALPPLPQCSDGLRTTTTNRALTSPFNKGVDVLDEIDAHGLKAAEQWRCTQPLLLNEQNSCSTTSKQLAWLLSSPNSRSLEADCIPLPGYSQCNWIPLQLHATCRSVRFAVLSLIEAVDAC